MASKPKISVLLPVYNAARYLPEALASLAGQTCRDFEVVAVDDGSTDGSGTILDDFERQHNWLRVLHQANAGIAVALNQAFLASQGDFIARMDADDIADKTRLALQAAFLQAHPAIGVCGSWAQTFGEGRAAILRAPITDDAIRSWLIFGSAFVHPAVMMRREVLVKLEGPYDVGAPPVEDYTLWLALSGLTQFYNLPKVLLRYRRHADQVSERKPTPSGEKLMRLRLGLLNRLGITVNPAEQGVHAALGLEVIDGELPQFREVSDWLERLCNVVPATGWCSEKVLRSDCTAALWRYVGTGKGGLAKAWAYGRAPVARLDLRTFYRMARLALR